MHWLPLVIKAIGSERTIGELIPWLEESICVDSPKFDDELLLALAEEIEKGWKKFGLWDERSAFLKIIQKLLWIDESHVRDQAAKCLCNIAKEMTTSELNTVLSPFVLELSSDVWFTGRLSACSLIPATYKQMPKNRSQLKNAFFNLCKDKMPLVRWAAAMNIGELTWSVEPEVI